MSFQNSPLIELQTGFFEDLLVGQNEVTDGKHIIQRTGNTDHTAENQVIQQSDDGRNDGLVGIYQTNTVVEDGLTMLQTLKCRNDVQNTNNTENNAAALNNTNNQPNNGVDLDTLGQNLQLLISQCVVGIENSLAIAKYFYILVLAIATVFTELHIFTFIST